MIRESEDLPEMQNIKVSYSADRGTAKISRIKKGHPRSDSFRSGDFFCIMKIKNIKSDNFLLFQIVFFVLLNLGNGYARAENQPVMLDTVVVTAEKPELPFKTGDVDMEQTPVHVSVIKREQFEGKTENLSEIIEKEAGVQIRQSGGLGSFSTVSLRGASSEQVMVFMDGILLNDASGGGVDLSNISLSDVEAIEIYRGVTPVNFGKASVGGAVNIRTRRSGQGTNTSVSAGYGSFGMNKFSGFLNHKPGKWDCLISADYLSSDNDFEFVNDNSTQWNTADDRTEERNNAQFDQKNILAKLGYDFSDDVRLDFSDQWFSKDQGLPGWNNSDKTATSFDTERNIATLNLITNNLGPYHFNINTRANYSRQEEEYDDRGGHVGLGEQHSKYITSHYDAGVFLEWLTEHNMLSFTSELRHEAYDPRDLLKAQNPKESRRNVFSIGLQNSFILFDGKLILTPALRYTFLRDELKAGISIWGASLDEKTKDEDNFSPQIGLKYCPANWLTIKANAARYAREPSFFELFGDRGFFTGNMELESEKGSNFDMGFEISRNSDDERLKRISFSLTGFLSDTDDLITRSYNSRGIGKSVNISSSCIKGIEAEFSMEFLTYCRLIANASWQDTENQSEIPAFDGKKLPGRFEKSYLTRIEARYGDFKLYAEYLAEKDLYYDTANLLEAEDKEEVNAGISWLFRSALLTFEAENIGDNQYEDFNGYPLPGRSYSLTVKYSF